MLEITHIATSARKEVIIEKVTVDDYKVITKGKFFFNWKLEKAFEVYKLVLIEKNEIVGLMSLCDIIAESRFEIKLLAVSRENSGREKKYEGITGNLIAFACREALKFYGDHGVVSLLPKTRLKLHYMKKYGMLEAGPQLFLDSPLIQELLKKY